MFQLLLLILGYALNAFRIALLVRIVADIVRGLNPGWRPKGILLVILELVFTVTDLVGQGRTPAPLTFGNTRH